jgi:hypothetical protein
MYKIGHGMYFAPQIAMRFDINVYYATGYMNITSSSCTHMTTSVLGVEDDVIMPTGFAHVVSACHKCLRKL